MTESWDPAAAKAWAVLAAVTFAAALVSLLTAVGFVLADWGISGRAVAAGAVGVACGGLCWMCARFHSDAVEGPPDEVYEAVEARALEEWPW